MDNNEVNLELISDDDFMNIDLSRVKTDDKYDRLFYLDGYDQNKNPLILFIKRIIKHLKLRTDGPYYTNSDEKINLSTQEIEVLKKISGHCESSLFKGVLNDLIYTQTKRNEYAVSAIENYLNIGASEKEDMIIIFLKRAMNICNTSEKIFKGLKGEIKEKTYNILPQSILGQYAILQMDKKLPQDEHEYFAKKFFDNGIALINDISRELTNATQASSIIFISAPCNIKLSFKFSADIYKKLNSQINLNNVYVNATISLFAIIKELKEHSYQSHELEGLMLQLVLLSEEYKSLTPLKSLKDHGMDMYQFYETLKNIKLSLVAANESETIKLNMNAVNQEAVSKILKSMNFLDAISILSNYNKGLKYDLKYENDGFSSLYQNISLSNDGRTTSIGEEYDLGVLIYYSYHGIAIDFYLSEIIKKYKIEYKTIEKIVNDCESIPNKIKEYVTIGLCRWLNKDIISSTFILVPLYEALVREIKNGNSISTLRDNNGCQEEPSLNTTLKFDGDDLLINEDLLFEMKSLLISKNGPNLRNTIAHALIDEKTLHSPICNYVCWRWLCIAIGSINIVSISS
ncbi:DUF4209 domain-containing protein [Pectobacterium carotovorum]|uniref:DUF4209 domain-containing protein n=1 Tax=Pectobacterium carotovorum TaxID=554 RepID=UPI0005827C28|nr:DUF4209 domain-containing protein [Pectobacterium carotovorum]KHS78716.1 hypothetical protein RC84_19635 [Pectobacterium carotovorum subsp. carotovorum]